MDIEPKNQRMSQTFYDFKTPNNFNTVKRRTNGSHQCSPRSFAKCFTSSCQETTASDNINNETDVLGQETCHGEKFEFYTGSD